MNSKKMKLELNETLVLSLEELEKVLGGGGGKPDTLLRCTNCDAVCQITCAHYLHMGQEPG